MKLKPSLLRNLLLFFLAFGTGVGVILPYYTQFFVEWKPGMYGWFFAGSVLAGTAIGIASYLLVKVVLLGKLQRIADIADAISQKDINQHCDIESHDMVGDIANSINRMTLTLRDLVRGINTESSQLSKASTSLQTTTTNSISNSVHQQSRIEQIATAINQMAASAKEVARHAEETANSTHEANNHGNTAKVVVVEAMGAVDVLAEMVKGAAEIITRLEQESGNIGNVLMVINGIAEQTNLLALNAAIEAARAGEQGRGFAVVADEVRTLANRTQQSTEEIGIIINRLQSGSNEAVLAMEQGQKQAQHGVDLTEQAAEVLATISGAISAIKDMSIQIANVAEEQNTVVDDVNKSIIAINDVTQESTRDMQQISHASNEVAELAGKLHLMVEDFKP